jgi:DNA-binding transcriptional LysR family regulator
MFKTETLLAFVQVAKHGSFTGAAAAQGQTPMALSKQVSSLEKQLAEPLFERTTRKVKLTEFGQAFLLKAQAILGQHQALSGWLESRQGKVAGRLTLVTQGGQTYDETVFPYLAEFHQLYPELELVFDVKEQLIDIGQHQYDIYWGIGEYLGDNHPSLKRRALWQAPFGIFAAPAYLEKYGTPQTPQQLTHHRMIDHLQADKNGILVVNELADQPDGPMQYQQLSAPVQTVTSHTALAIAGLGLINALADNYDIKAAVEQGTLVPVLKPYWFSSVEIFIYYQQVKVEQPKVRAFIDFFLDKRVLW